MVGQNLMLGLLSTDTVSLGGRSSPMFWLRTFLQLRRMTRLVYNSLALLGCHDSCGKVPNGPASLPSGSFNTRQGLKC